MGQTATTTQQTAVPERGQQETQLLAFLQRLAEQAGGQFGDLGPLASGDLRGFGPTGEDQRLVSESIGLTSDIAQQQAEAQLVRLNTALGENLAARNVQSSSIEGFQKAGLSAQALRDILTMLNQARQEGGQALLNLPFQRAGVALGANQALFQRLTGTALPSLQALLQGRLGQSTTTSTTETQPGFADLAKLGLGAAGLFRPTPTATS